MKIIKILTVFIVALMLIIPLSGCADVPSRTISADINLQRIHSEYFDVEVIEDLGGGCFIIRDKNTNVLYLLVSGYESSAMTPIYNSDGTVKVCEE